MFRANSTNSDDGQRLLGSEPLDERNAAPLLTLMRFGLVYVSGHEPMRATVGSNPSVVLGVNACTDHERRRESARIGRQHRSRRELYAPGTRCQGDVSAIVDYDPCATFLLEFDDATRELVELPTRQTRRADVHGDTRATCVHHTSCARDEIVSQHDLIVRDGVEDGNTLR